MISQGKQTFMQQLEKNSPISYQLSIHDVEQLCEHYKNKFDIRIINSGSTAWGQALLEKKKQAIKLMHNHSLPYARYFKMQLIKGNNYRYCFQDRHHFFKKLGLLFGLFDEIEPLIKKFIIEEPWGFGTVIKLKELTLEEIESFNVLCSTLPCKAKLDAAIDEWQSMKFFLYLIQMQYHFSQILPDHQAEFYKALEKYIVFITIDQKKIAIKLDEEITLEDSFEINKLCKQLSCCKILEAEIEAQQKYLLEKEIKSVTLTEREALEEIYYLQKNLSDSDCIGYIFSPSKNKGDHFESLIITREKTVNLINYSLKTLRCDAMYVPNYRPFIKLLKGEDFSYSCEGQQFPDCPQAGAVECGTLGLLYLKELLKNDAQQFRDFSLTFSTYEKPTVSFLLSMIESFSPSKKIIHLFFPSPHVLRYSQVSAFNEILVAMLTADVDKVVIEVGHEKKRKLEIETLEKILKSSIDIALQNDNVALAETNHKLLASLPTFRKAWLEIYFEKQKQHAAMHSGRNFYLMYRSLKMEQIANPEVPEGMQRTTFKKI